MTYRGHEGLLADLIIQAVTNVREFQDSHTLGKQGWEKHHGGGYAESLEWLYSSRAKVWFDFVDLDQDAVLDKLESEGVVPANVMRWRDEKG